MTRLTPEQLETLVYTVLGEAAGEGADGMAAVAHVIKNRSESGRFPSDPAKVAKQDKQFSTWNEGQGGNNPTARYARGGSEYQQAEQAVRAVFDGQYPDPTGGATHYWSPAGMRAMGQGDPSWAQSEATKFGRVQIGGHVFLARSQPAKVPPGSIPNVVASELDVQPRAVQGMPTPRSPNPSNPPLPQPRPERTANPPLPRLDPRKPNRMDLAADVPTVERRLPDLLPTTMSFAGQERGPTTAPRQPVVTPTPAQAEAATGFRLPGQSAPPAMTRQEQRTDNGQDRPSVAPRTIPGPSSPPKTQDRLDTGPVGIVPRSGTVQPTRQQVEAGTGFRLSSPLTEEVEVENPAYTALMKRVQQGEIELRGISPSGMAMSRDARARYEASLKALEAQRQQLAGMSRTTTVTRQVRQPVAQAPRPVVQRDQINPANHNAAQLAAAAAGRSTYTPPGGGPSQLVRAMNGKLRYTYGDTGGGGNGGSLL